MVRGTPYSRLVGLGRAVYIVSVYQIYVGKILTLCFKLVEGVDRLTRCFFLISIRLV